MKIIVGHSNMDLDCIASMVLARYLFPDHLPVRSSLVHPAARKLMNLYEERLGFAAAADLKGQELERMVVVDARGAERVAEQLRGRPLPAEIEVFDHHPAGPDDIPGAFIHEAPFGANATQLCLELKARGLAVAPEDATIALTGIYADTGNFTHANVRREDLEAAAWLLGLGASLKLVKDFLVPLAEKGQVVLFHEVLSRLERRTIRGHLVMSCYLELEEDSQGLGAVVERAFEVENCEILFGFFFFRPKGKLLVIARNSAEDLRLDELFSALGGGGHRQAASATLRTAEGPELAARILGCLEQALEPAPTAREIMSTDIFTIPPEASLLAASMYLERVNHTGAPVVDSSGAVVGFLTLRDIMKGRKAGQMHVPARNFMSKRLVTAAPATTVREIDELLFENDVGHLPIVEAGRLVGLVTRGDYLEHKRGARRRREAIAEGIAAAQA
ncbi:MAG TPA: CBS domain-containing protein [Spirochaetales bacterium]|nr:CBS domain-containing protein [Spirochaetales bacterium]HRY53521.1 CBS domain-containing protein [Spirochaetia bacterium]HRZ63795.1 CBS domain-containing protein [Spirochaetia bacterium]